MDSVVVMESGGRLPAWIDQEAGAESNITVFARRSDETLREFEGRVHVRLASLEKAEWGVLICDDEDSAEARACRRTLVDSLADLVARGGGSEVVLATAPSDAAPIPSLVQDTRHPARLAVRLGPAKPLATPELRRRVA